jgi:hypothetical protein
VVVKGGEDVIETAATGEAKSPAARLKDWTANLRSTCEGVCEGDESPLLIPKDRADLSGIDAVIGAVGEETTFGLYAKVSVEVGGGTNDGAGIDRLVEVGVDGTAIGVKISVATIKIVARRLRGLRRRGWDSLGGGG